MRPLEGIPHAPGALPLLGHVLPLLRNPLEFLAGLPAQGDLVRVRIGPYTAVVVSDPELLRLVLRDDRTFAKGGPFMDRVREVTGDGLATCPHGEHRRLRRLCQPAFHPSRLPGYAEVMTEQISTVSGSWRHGQILDVQAEMETFTGQTLTQAAFSRMLLPATLNGVADDITVIGSGFFTRMFLPPPLDRLPTLGNRRYNRARTRLRDTVSHLVTDRRISGVDHGDLMSILIGAHDEPQDEPGMPGHARKAMSDGELVDQLVTFLMGGTRSAATTLAWALHLLAHHPAIEQQLHAEVDNVLSGAPARFENLPDLEVADRIIKETLRLYPPGSIFTRIATADTRLGRHPIPAGTKIVYSAYLIHHRADLYPDPDRFDPDRWTRLKSRLPRTAFIPFGYGVGKCIGEGFASTETVLALATIAARWRLESIPGQHLRPVLRGTLNPQGLRMRVIGRIPSTGQTPSTRSIPTTP